MAQSSKLGIGPVHPSDPSCETPSSIPRQNSSAVSVLHRRILLRVSGPIATPTHRRKVSLADWSIRIIHSTCGAWVNKLGKFCSIFVGDIAGITSSMVDMSDTSPGRFYAAALAKLVIAHLVEEYDFQLANPEAPRWFTWRTCRIPREDVMAVFTPRSG